MLKDYSLSNVQGCERPEDNIDPEKKVLRSWGVKAAKYIWYDYFAFGSSLFFQHNALSADEKRTRNEYLTDLAMGKQDIGRYKPFLGINPRANKDTQDFVGAINWQIKNYATKRVNIAVSKIMNNEYDPIVTAADPLAYKQKLDFQARMEVYAEHQQFLNDLGISGDIIPGNMPQALMPRNADEVEILMQDGYKNFNSYKMERTIQMHWDKNRMNEEREMCAFDHVVYGACGMWFYMDNNFKPRGRRVHTSDWVIPFSVTPTFQNLKYVGYIEHLDESQFRKEIGGQYEPWEIDNMVEQYGVEGYRSNENTSTQPLRSDVRRGPVRIPVLRFRYRTNNTLVYMEKTDANGNPRLYEKNFDYGRPKEALLSEGKYEEKNGEKVVNIMTKEELEAKYGDERRTHRVNHQCVYEGSWIVGSEIVFTYGKMHHQLRDSDNWANTDMGVALYAANNRNGKVQSMVEQMEPVLHDLQLYHLKVQHIIAKDFPDIIAIDLDALQQADLKWAGGKKLSDYEKIKMLMQSGIMVFSSDMYKGLRGSNVRPVTYEASGNIGKIVHYLQLQQSRLMELDEIIGVNRVTAGSSLDPKQGKGTSEIMQANSETALDYLYRGDRYLVNRTYEQFGRMHVQSEKYSPKGYYEPALGNTFGILLHRTGTNIFQHDYEYHVEARPSHEAWQDFYVSMDQAVKAGTLSASDRASLTQIKNLKHAISYLKVMEERSIQRQQQMGMENVQQQHQVAEEAAQSAHTRELEKLQAETDSKILLAQEERKKLILEMKLKDMQAKNSTLLQGASKQILQDDKIQADIIRDFMKLVADAQKSDADREAKIQEKKESKTETKKK